MRRIGLLLLVPLLARADDPALGPDTVLRRVHDLKDLDSELLAVALGRVRALGVHICVKQSAIDIVAPLWAQLRVERVLREVREEGRTVVTLEVHFVEFKGEPRVKDVPAGKLDAFLEERRADRIASHTFRCRNFRKVSLELASEVPYVPDFDAEFDGTTFIVRNPRVEAAKESRTATFEPVVVGRDVRLKSEFTVATVALRECAPSFAPDCEMKVSLPEGSARTTWHDLMCAPQAFVVVDLGEKSLFVLVRATVAAAR